MSGGAGDTGLYLTVSASDGYELLFETSLCREILPLATGQTLLNWHGVELEVLDLAALLSEGREQGSTAIVYAQGEQENLVAVAVGAARGLRRLEGRSFAPLPPVSELGDILFDGALANSDGTISYRVAASLDMRRLAAEAAPWYGANKNSSEKPDGAGHGTG
ncbi:hypothetical protein ACFSM5_00705 [Lacibacterium aquatile]|uniref:Chemotaxis protein CheW n=1 Tax=Lacibacterium aquatile TaxID=1168082 RepID=A0ABW5DLM7_9PROT